MIPFNFDYYRPRTVQEAVEQFQLLQRQGKRPMYYSGGTEIITWARRLSIRPGAVIDIKAIPECKVLGYHGDWLTIGSCISLSALSAANPFPLLSEASLGIADQTARNQITLGGNICGRIHYREAVLPLLVSNSRVVLAGAGGMKEVSIHDVFRQHIRLENGQFVVQFRIGRRDITLPYVHYKKRQIGYVGYPVVTLSAVKKDRQIRMAFSGVCAFPFRSAEMERALNDPSMPIPERVEQAIRRLPAQVIANAEGSAAYRTHVLRQTMVEAMRTLEGR